jgi:hypothetical protein
MPTALIEKGFRFYFYMADLLNEPPHVHVDKQGKTAKFWLSPIRLADGGQFNNRELNQVERIIADNIKALLDRWYKEKTKLR